MRIQTICIVGAGVMGRLVAWSCVANGLGVKLFDISRDSLRQAEQEIAQWLGQDGLAGPVQHATLARLRVCHDLPQALDGVDLAFENVNEELSLKRTVHADINRLAAETVLIGTNASSLTCSAMAEASGRPDRFFNMNFTNPRTDRLVEVMASPLTSKETLRAALQWARTIGMVPLVARREIMGYIQNRIWRAIKKEALFLADQGYATPADIDRGFMLSFGVPKGPFAIMDQCGLATIQSVEKRYFDNSGDPSDRPPAILNDLVSAGHLGPQSGRGFYDYPEPDYEKPGWLSKDPPFDETH